MPRKSKTTLSGQPAQPVAATPGQVYGMGEEQMQMQRLMPAPQVQQVPGQAVAAPQGQPVEGGAAPDPAAAHASMMQQASALREQTGLLTTPTVRPTEPITAGLASGPGPGPSALTARQGSPAGDMLRRLSESTGDPFFADLARKAQV